MWMGNSSGNSFQSTLKYDFDATGARKKAVTVLLSRGVDMKHDDNGDVDVDINVLAWSFDIQAQLNPDICSPVKRFWLSYEAEDLLVMVNNAYWRNYHFISMEDAIAVLGGNQVEAVINKTMSQDILDFIAMMDLYKGEKCGYDNTQFVAVRHDEKDNPHIHVVMNGVTDKGSRINDIFEVKRAIAACRKISESRGYNWGKHKSMYTGEVHRPKDAARHDICAIIYKLSQVEGMTALRLRRQALMEGIVVWYRTDPYSGDINGVSFAKNGFVFSGSNIDKELSAKRLLRHQTHQSDRFPKLTEEDIAVLNNGGIIKGFNDHIISPARLPKTPQYVREKKIREEYHQGIYEALQHDSRMSYIYHVAALALDPDCGPICKRAKELSPYLMDERTDDAVDLDLIIAILNETEETVRQEKTLRQKVMLFLNLLLQKLLRLKDYLISISHDNLIKPEDLVVEEKTVKILRGYAKAINNSMQNSETSDVKCNDSSMGKATSEEQSISHSLNEDDGSPSLSIHF